MIRTILLGALASVLMTGAAAAGAENATIAPSASADDQRIICRKTLEVGSLVKKHKQCFTKAEWDRIRMAHREGAQKMVDGLATRCGQDGGVC